jgi:hypothetical protein
MAVPTGCFGLEAVLPGALRATGFRAAARRIGFLAVAFLAAFFATALPAARARLGLLALTVLFFLTAVFFFI